MTMRLVFCTVPDSTCAASIAHALVEASLAACVKQVPGVTSVYQWDGKVVEDSEVQLIIKTSAEQLDEAYSLVKQKHPYDVPEWVIIESVSASQPYTSWLDQMLR